MTATSSFCMSPADSTLIGFLIHTCDYNLHPLKWLLRGLIHAPSIYYLVTFENNVHNILQHYATRIENYKQWRGSRTDATMLLKAKSSSMTVNRFWRLISLIIQVNAISVFVSYAIFLVKVKDDSSNKPLGDSSLYVEAGYSILLRCSHLCYDGDDNWCMSWSNAFKTRNW